MIGGLPSHTSVSRTQERTSDEKKYIELPFFDDFSKHLNGQPDTALWKANSGVYVNNGLAFTPPTVNTASFDGLDYQGNPYDFSKEQLIGRTDSLVSHYFDLFRIGSGNQLVFEFYWQAEGLGELPDATDSLMLQGYRYINDSTYRWETLWSVNGDSAKIYPIKFRKERVLMKDAEYFHPNFKFKFQSVGRQSGSYDHWHLDYVLVYVLGKDNPLKRIDIAMGVIPNPVFGEYTAMPASIFFQNPAEYLTDTLFTTIHNVSDTINVVTPRCIAKELISGVQLAELETIAISENGEDKFQDDAFIGQVNEDGKRRGERLSLLALNENIANQIPKGDSAKIVYQFIVEAGEKNELIPTRNNDTLTVIAQLKDFWAYDDGEAEYGIGINQRFGKLAYQYFTPKKDTLTHIDIAFPKLGINLANENFNLLVWSKLDTLDETKSILLHRQNSGFSYSNSRNAFTRIELNNPIVVEGEYFIGFEQLGDLMLVVGYDKNTKSGSHIFYNVSSKWERNYNFEGSMMMRPVFQKKDIINGLEDDWVSELKFYPNPTTDFLKIEGKNLQKADILDLTGKILFTHSFITSDDNINVSSLRNGIYFVRIFSEKGWIVSKKLIISK
ncbi:MAG: hypothetical protein OHK0038_15870 [Flammeovirgaceae bacterium]